MKNASRILFTFLSLLFVSLISFGADVKPEVYSASAVYTSGRAKTVAVKIYVSSYTSDEEVAQLANILKTEGSDALLKAINKMDRGKLAVVGKTGNNVGVIRTRSTDQGTMITMVMERPVAFAELWRNTRSTDYPFGIIQMTVDKDGKGDIHPLPGRVVKRGDIRFTEQHDSSRRSGTLVVTAEAERVRGYPAANLLDTVAKVAVELPPMPPGAVAAKLP